MALAECNTLNSNGYSGLSMAVIAIAPEATENAPQNPLSNLVLIFGKRPMGIGHSFQPIVSFQDGPCDPLPYSLA